MSCRAGTWILALAALGSSWVPATATDIRLRPLPPIYVDGQGSSILHPQGVGCAHPTVFIVADTGNGRLLRYELIENTLRPTATITAPQLSRPLRAEVASGGDMFALDGKRREIVHLSAAGQFLGAVKPKDESSGFSPRSFKLDRDDRLWVLDLFTERVLILEADGTVVRAIAFPEGGATASDLTVTATGKVFVIDSVGKRVLAAGRNDTSLAPLDRGLEGKADFPTSIAVDDSGVLYVGDQNGGSILVLGPDGSFRARQSGAGWKAGLLRYPSGLCVGADDHLFVADRANNRIQVFAILR